MKKTILFLMAFLPMCLFAESISLDEARKIAENFFRRQLSRGNSMALRMVYDGETPASRSVGNVPALYVFDCISHPGFVIVSGDDATCPVLGYSYDSDFPEGQLPENVESWLQGMKSQINALRSQGMASLPQKSRAASTGDVVVQLSTPKWNQDDPFNREMPIVGGKRSPTGCTITSMAIAVRYLKWPENRTMDIPAYTTSTNQVSIAARPSGKAYDWDNMLLEYKSGQYSEAQAAEVARLMADIGSMMNADYRANETSANPGYVVEKLTSYMDYDKTMRFVQRYQYNKQDWYDLMKNELDNNRPIIYGGYKNDEKGEATAGHSFILDGYTTADYFGVNWGWGGYCDGYFKLDAMSPSGSGIGGNNDHYNDSQNAVIGLKKNEGGEGSYWITLGEKGFTNKPTNVKTNVPFSVSMDGIWNMGNATFNGTFLWALTDAEGAIKQELYKFYYDLSASQGFSEKSLEPFLKFTITKTINVGDRIRVFYQPKGETEWTLVKGGDECTWELLVGDKYTIAESTSLEYDRVTRKLKVQVKEGVDVSFISSDGKPLSSRVNKVGNTATINAEGLSKGTYLLKFSKGDEKHELKIQLGTAQSN